MSEELKGTNIAAPVVPFTSEDTYPTHYSLYGKGGFKVVGTALERDSIPQERLVSPTLCYVRDTGLYYEWDGTSWTDKSFGEKGDKGDKGDALEFDILGSYPTLDALKAAYPNGPTDGKNGVFKVGDSLYLWTGDKYEPLNLDIYRTFNLEQFTEVIPSGPTISIDFNKAPYAKVSLSGDNKIFNLVISNVKDGVSGKILVFQTGFKQISVGENIKGTIDLPLNGNTIALLTYHVLGSTIYIHSNTVLGDVQFPTPKRIEDFQTIYYDSSICVVSWTATHANNIYDKVTEYDMRYSNGLVDADDPKVWASLKRIDKVLAPASPGEEQRFTVSGLQPNQEYYIYLKSVKINYGLKYVSESSDPAYCRTKGNPSFADGFYRLNLSTSMLYPRRKDGWKDSGGIVHGIKYITDETEKDSYKDDGTPDLSLRQYETYWRTPSGKHDNPYNFLIELNKVHELKTLYILSWTKASFRVFIIKDVGYAPEYICNSKQMYNGWEVLDLQGKQGRFINLVYDVEGFASNEPNVAIGEECYPTANQNNLIGGIYKIFLYGRYTTDKPNFILPPARNTRPKHSFDEYLCTNGHFYQQGRIHSMCSGSHVRLYGALGHFGPSQGTDNYQRIADYRVRTNQINWVMQNGGGLRYLRDNIRDTYHQYGLKPFVAGTGIIDYCRWPGYGPDKDKNKCLDNYWLPDKWIPLPTKGQSGTDRYFSETTNPHNYKTLSKTCNHLIGVYGDKVVNINNLDLYPSSESTDNGLGYMDAIEHINEPDATWLGWMWYMQPEECAAQLSAIYDGHCMELLDEDGNIQKYGVKNINPEALVVMPGMAGLNTGYVLMMYLWAKQHRKDGKFPCDVLNFHSYFSNIGNQGGDATIPIQYAITCEESLNNEVGGEFFTMADFRNRYLSDKEIWITEFGYGECGGRNTQSKYQCYTQAGRQIGDWVIPDRHRSDVKGSWTLRAVLNMMRIGFDMCHYYSTEMEASYFDAGQWGAGAGYEMFHWNDCKDLTPGAKADAIKGFEHSYPRGGFALTGLFGPLLACGGFPISRAYWWLATFRNRLKGYVYTGMKYHDSDKRIMIFCFRKQNEDKGAYVVYLNDNQNTGVANVDIAVPSELTKVTRVSVYIPELVSPESIPNNWVEYDQHRTQLPTSRREKYINGTWVIQNPKYAGQYESYSQAPAAYPLSPVEGDGVTILPTLDENPYFPIVGPVGAKYSIHGKNPSAQEYEWIDPNDPTNEDGTAKWSLKYNNALAWRQVDAVCDYIEYTQEGQHGINGDESSVSVLRDTIIVNVSEFPEIYFFDAVPDPDFRSEVTDLTAVPVNSTSIKLYWNNHNTEDTGYEIYISSLPETGYAKLKDIGLDLDNVTLVNGLNPDTTYYFKMRAMNGTKVDTLSDYASATTYSFLPTPMNVHCIARTASSLLIAWDYLDTSLPDFVKFTIYRAGSDGNFVVVGDVEDKLTHSYKDTGLSVGSTYLYKVRAVGMNGQSEYSIELEARTLTAEECPPTLMTAITDKLGTKITLNFDLPISPFDPDVKSYFTLTEDDNVRFIISAFVDESDNRNIILRINQDSLNDYDKRTNIRISYTPGALHINSIYNVPLEAFSNMKVINTIGNFTNIEATFKINLLGDDSAVPESPEWNNLAGNPEAGVVSLSNLVDTYGRVSSVSICSVNNPPSFVWGGPGVNTGVCDIPDIEPVVVNTAWNVAYRAFVTENMVARLTLQSLNPERRYTIRAYASFKNQTPTPPSGRIKVNEVYSNIVSLLGNKSSFMVLEDCTPSNDGTLQIDCLPMRETTASAVPFNFFIIEEYRSSSDPENKDVFLREISVVEDNGNGAVTSQDIHIYLNCIGTPTHFRVAETEDALLLSEWVAVPEDMNVPFALSENYGLKNVLVQVKNTYTESNIRRLEIEYKDPYVPLVLKNIYINKDESSTYNPVVQVLFEKEGAPTYYRIGELPDLSGMEWTTWTADESSEIEFAMSPAAGQKTVYAQLKDMVSESSVKVDTINLHVIEYENVTLDINVASSVDPSGVSIAFAPLKYNKKFAYGITSDDTHVSAWNVIFKYFNGMWMDDLNYFHMYDVKGILNQRTTGAYAPRALTYTDGCGTVRRFEVNTASWYNLEKKHLEDAGGVQYPYLLWPEVEEMLDFDCGVSLHDVKAPDATENGGTIENIILGIADANHVVKNRIGRSCMVMTEPNGDSKYTTAAELSPQIRMITRQHNSELGYNYVDLSDKNLNVDKLKVARLFNENPVNGLNTYKQQFLEYFDGKYGLYGEFGCHGADKNKAIDESLRTWPFVSGFFDWMCDTYGQPGSDTVWFATNEEVIQYKTLCKTSVIEHVLEGNILHVALKVPIIEGFNWRELTLLISGLTSGEVIGSNNIKGLSYGLNDNKYMINVNLDTTLVTRAEKYTNRFTASYSIDDKVVAEYFIQRLKPSLRTVYQDRIAAAMTPPLLIDFSIYETIPEGTDTTYIQFYYATDERATHYMVSESSTFEGAEWIPISNPNVYFNITNVSGKHTLYLKVKNQFGESEVKSASITYIPAELILVSMILNSGDVTTANPTVRINFICTGLATHYMVSEFSEFDGAMWQPYYENIIQYVLSEGYGVKTVYLKLKNEHTETIELIDTIELIEVEPTKTIVSLAGVVKIVSNPIVDEKVINVISVSRHETFPNLQLKDSQGNNACLYMCKPSLYPTGISGLVDNRFAPALDDSGVYPSIYLDRYITGNIATTESLPVMLRFGELSPGTYAVRILSSGDSNVSIPSDKWINTFYEANLVRANLSYDIVNNKDKFIGLENVEVKADGILDIRLWTNANMHYRPGVNLIEIINNNE